MLNIWNIKSRAHQCARTERPFEEGEEFHTAIYFDTEAGDFVRRDICTEAWEDETRDHTPFSSWKNLYEKPEVAKPKAEITGRENAETLLRRLIDEDQSHTEHARYILALMLERKKLLVPKARKENDSGAIMLIYEHRKTGEVFLLRDPELKLDEVAGVQEEVATLLGFTEHAPAEPPASPPSAPAAAPASEVPPSAPAAPPVAPAAQES